MTGNVVSVERLRFQPLYAYDTMTEQEGAHLNALTSLAATLCRTPIAAISLVRSDRLWFKAKIGLAMDKLDRNGAFCDVVVTTGEALILKDTTLDPRFRSSPLVCGGLGVRAYIGHPLKSPFGAVLGCLCVIDTRVRKWSDFEIEVVRLLAAQALARLELCRVCAELSRLREEHRDLEARSLAGRMDDQRRVAAELHDGLGQDLTGLSLLLRAASANCGEQHTQMELKKIGELARDAIETCRRIAREHMAYSFIDGDLRESIEKFLAGVNQTTSLRCELRWATTVALPDRTVAYNLYCIAQEAITNAVRHSRGQRIQVQLSTQNDRVCLDVDDDGTGLRDDELRNGGVGLDTMRYRARALGARLELISLEPRGLRVRCEIPFAELQ